MNSKKVVDKQALTSQFYWMNSKKVVDKQALTSQFYWMNSKKVVDNAFKKCCKPKSKSNYSQKNCNFFPEIGDSLPPTPNQGNV